MILCGPGKNCWIGSSSKPPPAVTQGTVRGYAHHILEKFEVHSRDELRELLAHWDFRKWE